MSQVMFRKIAVLSSAGLLSRGRYLSALPKHIVVGMPALSPTMTSGTIGKWTCKVGDKMAPGDSLAEVETDKASMTFESQDEFVVAKILVEQGAEVKVGDPIMVTVEEGEDIAAFANFTIAAPVAPTPPAAPTPVPTPAAAKPVEAPKPAPTVTAPVVSTPPKVSEVPKPVPTRPAPGAATFVYGSGILKGALANKLASEQKAYLAKYGRSVHSPIKIPAPAK